MLIKAHIYAFRHHIYVRFGYHICQILQRIYVQFDAYMCTYTPHIRVFWTSYMLGVTTHICGLCCVYAYFTSTYMCNNQHISKCIYVQFNTYMCIQTPHIRAFSITYMSGSVTHMCFIVRIFVLNH